MPGADASDGKAVYQTAILKNKQLLKPALNS
jgi:hypothetical protein